MAGRKQFDIDAALTSAMLVFWEHGYADASLQLLTRATGLGRGSLYATFGGKGELFAKCLSRYGDLYRTGYERALDNPDPVEGIRGLYESMIRRMVDPDVPDGCLVAQSAALATSLPEPARAAVATMLDQQRTSVAEALLRGGFSTEHSRTLADYVVAVRQSLAVLHRSGATEEHLKRVAGTTCETITR